MKIYVIIFCSLFALVVSSPIKSKDGVRIVGGHEIDITDAPHQVSLVRFGRHSCGGSLVAADIVVTAAHCVLGSEASSLKVRVGSTLIKDGGELIEVEELEWHKGFTYSKMDYDIAVLLLKEPVEFNDRVAVVEMADEDYEIDDGEFTVVTGWGNLKEGGGSPQKLQSVEVPTVGNKECQSAYAPFYDVTPRMLCAGSNVGGKDACQGDSGGPLVHNGKLSGVVSWGIGCARPQYPGVYAKVAALRPWIDQNIDYLRTKKVLRGF